MNPIIDRLSFAKVYYHREALDQWRATGDTTGPVHVQLSLTNGCNHRCPWCSIAQLQKHHQPTVIDGWRLVQFLGEMKECGLKACTLVGNGEPLSHPDAAEIIRMIHRLGLDVGIFTNASYLTGAVADAVLDCATFVRMTMNGADVQTYQRTHGLPKTKAEDEFWRCVDNVRDLSRRRTRAFPTVGVQCATHQWNYRQLRDQCFMVKEYMGADYFAIKPVINRSAFHGRKANEFRPRNDIDLAELEPILKQCEDLADERFQVYAKRDQFADALPHDFNDGRDYPACVALPFESYIHENGNFDICGPIKLGGTTGGQHGESGAPLFNIHTSSFRDIWHSPERQAMMRDIDLSRCPAACRPHPLNKLLWGIRRDGVPDWAEHLPAPDPQDHPNFL